MNIIGLSGPTLGLLKSYRIDRASGLTSDGSTQLVVLVLRSTDGRELSVAMAKADAMFIAHQLTAAACEARDAMNK